MRHMQTSNDGRHDDDSTDRLPESRARLATWPLPSATGYCLFGLSLLFIPLRAFLDRGCLPHLLYLMIAYILTRAFVDSPAYQTTMWWVLELRVQNELALFLRLGGNSYSRILAKVQSRRHAGGYHRFGVGLSIGARVELRQRQRQ